MGRTCRILALAALATACGTEQNPLGGKYALSQKVTAADGATLTVSPSEDSKLAGVSIFIPPGALARDTTITIAEGAPLSLAAGSQSVTPVADFGPDGTTFSKPATITLPYQLPAGADPTGLSAVGVEPTGAIIVYAGAELSIDPANGRMSFSIGGFTRYGGVSGPPCPAGDTRCFDCGGGGTCQASGQCPAMDCPASDGGVPNPGACPPGEEPCCCGQCLPRGACTMACPAICPADGGVTTGDAGSADAGGSGGSDAGVACPPGEEPCCCGQCIGKGGCTMACPAVCPIDAGTPCPTGETNCNGHCIAPGQACSVCPPGEYDCCGQCLPENSGIACACPAPEDGGPSCPPGQVPCDGTCIPSGVVCVPCPTGQTNCCGTCETLQPNEGCGCATPVDAGPVAIDGGVGCVTCPQGEYWCGCGSTWGHCVPNDQACPMLCPANPDGGAEPVCTACPPGDILCDGACIPDTQPCGGAADAGTTCVSCPSGEYWCGCGATTGQCIPDSQACPLMCPAGIGTCGPCPAGETFCQGCDGGGTCEASGICPTMPCQIEQDAGTSADAGGCWTCPSGTTWCGCTPTSGRCIAPPQTCPLGCAMQPCAAPDAGTGCPQGYYRCPGGQCIRDGAMCTAPQDGGTQCTPKCQTGYKWCGCSSADGQCIPENQICPLMCPSYPPCP